MSDDIREIEQQITECLDPYTKAHPDAEITIRSPNVYSIRIRAVDPDFAGLSRGDREPELWSLLKELPDDVFTRISMLLLLTPEEMTDSWANREFEDPIPTVVSE